MVHVRSWRRAIVAALLVVSSSAAVRAAEVLDIADRRELFVDTYLIDRADGVRQVLHQPVDRGPVMPFDRPWEGAFSGYVTILHDGDRFRLYYRGLPEVDAVERTCYAESSDGLNWTKPELGLHEVDGSTANNVLLVARDPATTGGKKQWITHNFAPMLDTRPGVDPSERFKALGGNGHAVYALASADGIHWRKLAEEPVIRYEDPGKVDPNGTEPALGSFAFDSQNVAFWSEAEGKYVAYTRLNVVAPRQEGAKSRVKWRSVARAESDDFRTWSELRPMTYSDTGSMLPSDQLYTNQTQPYFRAPHLYVATAARLFPGRQVLTDEEAAAVGVHPKYFKDTSDAVLMTSRGGYAYDRTFLNSLIRPGIGAANWVSRSNYPVLNVVQTGEHEMSIYTNRNYAQPTAYLNRYSLRLDGFGSIQADHGGGELVTRPLRFTGDELVLNFSTSAAGGVRVEIQDETGVPLPGFTLDDCREVIGDEIERVVRWRNGADVSRLAGRPVRLRFVLRDADVYALRFREAAGTP